MVKLLVREKESIQEAVRRFRKLVERSGIKKEMRRREYYEKPSETNRRQHKNRSRYIEDCYDYVHRLFPLISFAKRGLWYRKLAVKGQEVRLLVQKACKIFTGPSCPPSQASVSWCCV